MQRDADRQGGQGGGGDAGTFLATTSSEVADTARLVLEIVPGERPLRPDFGCRVHFLAPIRTASDRQVAAALVEEALDSWVPWLRVERAEVLGVEGNKLDVSLHSGGSVHEFRITHRSTAAAVSWPEVGDGEGGSA